MHTSALYPHITDQFATAHPEWVQWEPTLGWVPRVAGGADEGNPDDDTNTGTDQGDVDQDVDTGSEEKISLTQAELDAMLQKRLGQAKKAWDKDQADAAEKAKMSEAERLKAEKVEAEQAAQARTEAANARIVKAEAKVAAVAAGVNPDRAAAFLRVVDLGDIEVNNTGDPDSDAITKAVAATLKDFPEFATTGKGASSAEHGGKPKPKPTSLAGAVAQHYSAD